MKTVFFDITDTVNYFRKEGSMYGISRVSFEVIKKAVERTAPNAANLSFWDRKRREYVAIDASTLRSSSDFSADFLNIILYGKKARVQGNVAPTLMRYRNNSLKYALYSIIRDYHAMKGHESHFTKRGSSISEWRTFKGNARKITTVVPVAVRRFAVRDIAKPGDQLVILGATWGVDGLDSHLQHLQKNHGIEIYQLIHDMIPIIAPEYLGHNYALEFYRWLEASTNYCKGYFTNSYQTADDLQSFMNDIDKDVVINVLQLAQKFNITNKPKVNDSVATVKSHLQNIPDLNRSVLNATKMPYVLVVGTLEIRKNLWRLAQAWQRLSLEAGVNVPKLVFAGKRGWHNDDFDALMQATGNLGGWVHFVDRPNDNELALLYEKCLFTVTVSLYEGWGLPIGESLSFGKTAVVANNSSMPEVGGDLVEYCDAHSIDSIHAACRHLIVDSEYRCELEERILATRLRTWDDVAQDLLEYLKIT